jgi:ATP-dependent exoDNAse (exonuclease V) beta subunit
MGAESDTHDVQRTLLADAAARAAAVDTRRSFLLQAPAGSGKTTVLTCRLLALLAVVDEPEEVLAITFTRKAAAEMRERVFGALQAAVDGRGADQPEAPFAAAAAQRDRLRNWQLLASPARLRVMTIDAYCQTLCAQLPISSRNGLRLEVATSPRPLYAAAARRVLEHALHDAQLVGAAQLLFARLDNDWERLEHLLIVMLEQRAHWLRHVLPGDGEAPTLEQRVGASLQSVVNGRLAAIHDGLPRELREQGARLAAHAALTLQEAGGELASDTLAWLDMGGPLRALAEDLPRWRFMCALSVNAQGEWRKAWNKNQGLLPEHRAQKQQLAAWVAALAARADAKSLIEEVLALPDVQILPEEAAALAALSQLLRLAAAELQLEFAAQGRVDFAAIAAAARAALTEEGQPTDLALRCGSAIGHVLIDEFQDTSLEQFELLSALTAGWESGDGRTLFAVGDPMQSIYQFREAEVGLFLRARDRGVGALRLTSLQLRRNFRSAPALIEWVNRYGVAAFPAHDDARLAAIRYLPALAARAEIDGAVSVHPMLSGDAAAEAREIAALIGACRARDPAVSIAVLVNSRQHAAPIVAALQAEGVSIRGVRLEPLRERPVVRDLCALARALQHLGDRTAWLALLHGPHCGLTLTQLQALAEAQTASVWELLHDTASEPRVDADARARLARLNAALSPALRGPERALPLWQRVHRAWLRLGGPAGYSEERDLLDAQEFIQALAIEPHTERLAGDAFDDFAAELYAAPASAAALETVDVLTMHGAKGLEWDVVIVPGIGRAQRSDREPLLHWLDLPGASGDSELLLSPISASGARAERSLAQYIRRLRKQRARLERARLLYVAATRARRQLHWFGALPARRDGELAPRTDTLLGILWPSIGDSFFRAHAEAAARAAPVEPSSAPPAPIQWRLPADWAPQGLLPPVRASRLELSLREIAVEPEYLWVGLSARAVGTIVHAELQRLAQLPQLPVAPDAAPQAYDGWLAELGVPSGERAAAGERLYQALAQTLRDPRGRWLLGNAHREAHSEWRLTGLYAGRVVNVIIDRMLIEAQGERWLVDYKTSSHEGSNLEGFLAQEAERYGPQLRRYAALVAAASPGPVRVALYFPLLSQFRELLIEPGLGSAF